MNWASRNPRWRLRKWRLAPMSWGKPKERKARDTLSAPACGLVASCRGRGSKTKGVLCSVGNRAAIEMIYRKSIDHCQREICSQPHFSYPIRKLGEDQGVRTGSQFPAAYRKFIPMTLQENFDEAMFEFSTGRCDAWPILRWR